MVEDWRRSDNLGWSLTTSLACSLVGIREASLTCCEDHMVDPDEELAVLLLADIVMQSHVQVQPHIIKTTPTKHC